MFSWSPSATHKHRVSFYPESNDRTIYFDVLHDNQWHEVNVKTIEEMPTDVKELHQIMKEAYQDFICCAPIEMVNS
jgi:hypothetical protein